jgi:hypothetical protein
MMTALLRRLNSLYLNRYLQIKNVVTKELHEIFQLQKQLLKINQTRGKEKIDMYSQEMRSMAFTIKCMQSNLVLIKQYFLEIDQ